jgi:hypothetical protein
MNIRIVKDSEMDMNMALDKDADADLDTETDKEMNTGTNLDRDTEMDKDTDAGPNHHTRIKKHNFSEIISMWYRYFSAFRILFHRKSAEFRIFVHGIP